MKRLMLILVMVLAPMIVATAGCFNADVRAPETIAVGGRHTTLGQELADLKKARDDGAITEAEYQKAKAKLIEAADKRKVDRD